MDFLREAFLVSTVFLPETKYRRPAEISEEVSDATVEA
jgi:hypothetical protein